MPEGSGRKVIAAQAGGAFWAGGLVAAAAGQQHKTEGQAETERDRAPHYHFLFSGNDQLIAPEIGRQ